jgi:chromosome segregation ATPase
MSTAMENQRLDSSAALASLQSTLDAVRVEQTSLIAELAKLKVDLDSSSGALGISDGRVKELETQISDLQARFDAGVVEMDGLKGELFNMGQAGVEIQARLDASCIEVARVQGELDQQIALVVAAGEREVVLNERVVELEAHVESLGSSLTEAKERYDANRAERDEQSQNLAVSMSEYEKLDEEAKKKAGENEIERARLASQVTELLAQVCFLML